MANLKENNLHNLKLMVNKDEYWDFFVDKDTYDVYSFKNGLYESCLISYIDACNKECVSGDTWLFSSKDYSWENSVSIDNTLYNISYNGLDNGLFQFRKDKISNKEFLDFYQSNSFRIDENDFRLKLHSVSGSTQQYEYPLHADECQIKLNGGFYQGFFETECDKYQVLPNKLLEGTPWEFEFELKKCDLEPESKKTLNDKYPNNKGIFFYIGTRAENKWVYLYKQEEDECFTLSPDNYVEDAYIDKRDYIIGNFYDPSPDFSDLDKICEKNAQVGVDDGNTDQATKKDESDAMFEVQETCTKDNYDTCSFFGFDDFVDFPIDFDCNEERKSNLQDLNLCDVETEQKPNEGTNMIAVGKQETFVEHKDNLGLSKEDYDSDYWEPELDISDFDYQTTNGISFTDANKSLLFTTDNKFILFNRTCSGYTVDNWVEGTQMEVYGKKKKFKENLFVLMNRTCSGYTVDNIDQLRDKTNNEYDYSDFYGDLYDNALAFRITDNGEIGYRMLTLDCSIEGEDKTHVDEGYSFPNVIKDCQWQTIHVKIKPSLKTMKLYFYVDGKLVYVTKDLPKLNLRPLNETYEKQEGVPYNISIGGGTQGLAETILPNYMLNPTRVYPIEKNFGGSFIGYFKSFKFYSCGMEYGNIYGNYKFEMKKL